jgi:phosphatidylglycerophosphate synthase
VSASPPTAGLAFKAYEIEELVDIYFYRRLGIVSAWGAKAVGLSPNAVSILAGVVGGIGGILLAFDGWDWLGVALIVGYGVLDSADGQLARITGQTSEWGRVLDGIAGYVTHVAAYLAILARALQDGGSPWTILLMLAAGVSTIAHAQLYDYHRTSYAAIVVKGRPAGTMTELPAGRGLVGLYERTQRGLAGLHPRVEAAIARRAEKGVVRDEDRQRYRASFLRLVPAWNVFGDNGRRYGFLVFTALGHLHWFFWYVLALNVPLLVIWRVQRAADAAFLAARVASPERA